VLVAVPVQMKDGAQPAPRAVVVMIMPVFMIVVMFVIMVMVVIMIVRVIMRVIVIRVVEGMIVVVGCCWGMVGHIATSLKEFLQIKRKKLLVHLRDGHGGKVIAVVG
jgi:hypothetical protein